MQTGRWPRIIYADNAAGYVKGTGTVTDMMKKLGGNIKTTIPNNPEESAIEERLNIILMDGVRELLYTAAIYDSYWPYAAYDVKFKQNILTHRSIGRCICGMDRGDATVKKGIHIWSKRAYSCTDTWAKAGTTENNSTVHENNRQHPCALQNSRRRTENNPQNRFTLRENIH